MSPRVVTWENGGVTEHILMLFLSLCGMTNLLPFLTWIVSATISAVVFEAENILCDVTYGKNDSRYLNTFIYNTINGTTFFVQYYVLPTKIVADPC